MYRWLFRKFRKCCVGILLFGICFSLVYIGVTMHLERVQRKRIAQLSESFARVAENFSAPEEKQADLIASWERLIQDAFDRLAPTNEVGMECRENRGTCLKTMLSSTPDCTESTALRDAKEHFLGRMTDLFSQDPQAAGAALAACTDMPHLGPTPKRFATAVLTIEYLFALLVDELRYKMWCSHDTSTQREWTLFANLIYSANQMHSLIGQGCRRALYQRSSNLLCDYLSVNGDLMPICTAFDSIPNGLYYDPENFQRSWQDSTESILQEYDALLSGRHTVNATPFFLPAPRHYIYALPGSKLLLLRDLSHYLSFLESIPDNFFDHESYDVLATQRSLVNEIKEAALGISPLAETESICQLLILEDEWICRLLLQRIHVALCIETYKRQFSVYPTALSELNAGIESQYFDNFIYTLRPDGYTLEPDYIIFSGCPIPTWEVTTGTSITRANVTASES